MRRVFVVLAAAIVFAPRLALSEAQAEPRLPDAPPQTDYLPLPADAPPTSMTPASKPLLMLGLLAAFSQWRLASGGASTLTTTSEPLAKPAFSDWEACHARCAALNAPPPLSGYGAPTAQPYRRAPPRDL
ncbi:MAG: hypothetical protein ACK4P1_03990 [Aggregatilineales bacterium]